MWLKFERFGRGFAMTSFIFECKTIFFQWLSDNDRAHEMFKGLL